MKSPIEKLLPITALSYWRYTRLKKCGLSGAYPSSAVTSMKRHSVTTRSQIVGKIFHSQMEAVHDLSTHGKLNSAEFRIAFNAIIDRMAAEIENDPSSRHLGDITLWPELSEIYRSLSRLVENRRRDSHATGLQIHSEETLYSKDKLLLGQLDAFFVDAAGIDLVDYKSGAISEGDLPKEDYANQLYFYAYLLLENYDRYPRSLTLTGKSSESMRLEGSIERSSELAQDMRTTLAKYNDAIAKSYSLDGLTNPSSENCSYCEAKPVCVAFWREASHMELPQWAQSVVGIQTAPFESSRTCSSALCLSIEHGSTKQSQIRVTRVFRERYKQLEDKVGQRLMLLNLRLISTENPSIFEATDRTMIFPTPDGW